MEEEAKKKHEKGELTEETGRSGRKKKKIGGKRGGKEREEGELEEEGRGVEGERKGGTRKTMMTTEPLL